MDLSQKLDKIDQLVRYSGLESKRARELLEKTGWNVDSAYRLYKKGQMDQTGYKVNPNRYSETVSTSRPAGHHPATDYMSGFGSVLTGMGPATHSAYLPSQVPKFPVERPQERIIPIQIENKPSQSRLERQDAVRQPLSTSQPTQVPVQARASYPLTTNYFPNQVRLPPKVENLPSQTVRGSKPVHVPVAVRTETYPNQQLRANIVEETAKEHPKFIIGDGSPKESSATTTEQPLQQQQQQPLPKSCNVDNVGSTTPKLLKRGISKISQNALLVDEERVHILQDINEDCHDNMYVQTFILPDVTGYAEDFRAFLEKDLIETSTLVSLEQAGRLNWWAEMGICQRLIPMATSGDGNCLLHAASLAMWGIHDRQLMLRKALYDTLTKKYYRTALYRRWRWQQTQANKQAGLIFSGDEWKAEWDTILRIASTTPRAMPGNSLKHDNSCCDSMVTQAKPSSESHSDSPVVYESLEEFHVFALSHVIQRPIIVVADTILKDSSGEALAPIPFGGIYLPLEVESTHCHRSPLLLTYDAAHFSALVPMEDSVKEKNGLPVAIPIVGPTFEILPIHFSIDPGVHFDWEKNQASFVMSEESKLNLLKRYLDMEKLPITSCFTDSSSDKNSTGSYESDDGIIDKKDKKDNNKVSQQLQSVSKQFGSFGKSMGKKLKNLGKGDKKEKKRKLSVTQSSKIPLTISALGEFDQQCVWCCKLTSKRSETHQKMIDNYLFDAGERFKKEKTLRNMKNNEIISRVHVNNKGVVPSEPERVPCVTSGCQFYGNANTSYLCAKCFDEHKRQALDQEKDMYNSYSNNKKSRLQDDAKKFGKSKFYDMQDSAENVSNKLSKMSIIDSSSKQVKPEQEKINNIPDTFVVDLKGKQQTERNSRNIEPQIHYPREPSPDYDNVDYGPTNELAMKLETAKKQSAMQTQPKSPKLAKSPKIQPKVDKKGNAGVKCRGADCDFYGNKDMDYYCSRCYKSQPLIDLSSV